MQLAASQRTHPPPVPPRPSRQVVAEALKKTPRPPCPTRQAPPPPNQKPWRVEEHQRLQQQLQQKQLENGNSSGGRTIVYESTGGNKVDQCNNQRSRSKGEENDEEKENDDGRPIPATREINVNGRDSKTKPAIDDTSRRKDDEDNNNNNNNSSIDSDRDLCESPKQPSEAGNSAERKNKKKALNVTFKEERVTVEAVIEHHNHQSSPVDSKPEPESPSSPSTNIGATVVVIDEVIETPNAKRKSPNRSVSNSSSNSSHSTLSNPEETDNIKRQDWLEAGVRYSSTKITLPAASTSSSGDEAVNVAVNGFDREQRKDEVDEGDEDENEEEEDEEDEEARKQRMEFGDLDFSSIIERIAMSSLQGLPPLPRSLSGFNLNGAGLEPVPAPPLPARSTSRSQQHRSSKTPSSTSSLSSQGSATRPSPQGRQLTTLDTQLAILRREMFGLRQLDLSLLSQLWSLNESIQEFRQLLQEQEDRAPSPSPSSDEGDDTSYGGTSSSQQQQHQPPPPPRRPPGTVAAAAPSTPHRHPPAHHHHHHHRASRLSNRSSSNLPISDESPSSEEYGPV